MSSGPVLTPKIIFGHEVNVEKNTHYITDDEVVYPCSGVLIFRNMVTNTEKYLTLPEKTTFLKLLLVSPQKNLVAALVNSPTKADILIYDAIKLKKMRTLTLPPEATTKIIEWMDFSYDEKYIMVITGDPDWMMLAFNWERGKVETSTKANYITNPTTPVREVVCSPVDSSILVIFGKGIFRLMNMQETIWRQYGFQKAESFDITSCCFLTGDRIMCGTQDGLLLLIELGELKYIFEADSVRYINAKADKEEETLKTLTSAMVLERAQALEEEGNKEDKAVRALTPFPNGFAFSCGPTVVHFFHKVTTHKYKKRNVYQIIDKDFRENQTVNIMTIKHLAINPSESAMVAVTKQSQLYSVKLWGPEMDIAGTVPFTHFGNKNHTGPINDLDLCLWKPIFMTSGKIDRTVRVWNYETLCLEMVKQYQEDVHSVSLHPTGLYAAIGFSDKLRFLIVCIDDLQVCREFPIRECPKSCFSRSGHLLAAVNRNVIQVYNIITFHNVINFKGHSGLIRCLQWTPDDTKLISCGMDGAIYEWDPISCKRIGEIVNKGISYTGCTITANGKRIYAVGSDDMLKEIKSSNIIRSISLQEKGMRNVVLSQSNLMMFISGAKGSIMSVKMPIEEPPEFTTFHYLTADVSQMKLSMDDKVLITCSDLGAICIWELSKIEGKAIGHDEDFCYFSEILISKNDLEEKFSSIKDLTQRTYELEMEHAYQMRRIKTVYKEKLTDVKETYVQAVEELRGTLETLEANHNTELNNITSDVNVIKERHETEMLELEIKYNTELTEDYRKVKELEGMTEAVTRDYQSKLANLQETKDKAIEELTLINESKIYNLNKMVEEARDEINKEIREHTAITDQIEDDNDREIELLKSKYERMLKGERESIFRLKGESGVLKKKIFTSQKEVETIQLEMMSVTSDIEKFKVTKQVLEKEILDLKRDINERDQRIQEKERRIYDLKIKDQELERCKFVLNCRIKELKNQIEPRDREIKERKEQIADMECELYELQKVNMTLDGDLNAMREKLGYVYKMLHAAKGRWNTTTKDINRVKNDIFNVSGYIQDPKKLRDGIKRLYMKYVTDKDFDKARKGDTECTAELQRQINYLEGIANTLKEEVRKTKHLNLGEGMMYMESNWKLMDEIFKLRKKLKITQYKLIDLETLICVRLTKLYSPRQAHMLVQKAMKNSEEVREECEIQLNEATERAALMREELDCVLDQMHDMEEKLNLLKLTKTKKARETLKFDIPSHL